jgi:hypothetical protein
MNHGSITTNLNQRVLQPSGNIQFHFHPKGFKVTPSEGKIMLTVFWDFLGVLLSNFQKRGENMNSAAYCEVLLKLRCEVSRKYLGQQERELSLHHENAKTPTARATKERIQELQLELLEHPPYCPVLAPSGFHLFVRQKATLAAKFP